MVDRNGNIDAALNCLDKVGVEVRVSELLDRSAAVGGHLRWLDDDAVASCDRLHQRLQCRDNRCVPRSNDRDDAQRLIPREGRRTCVNKLHLLWVIRHPFVGAFPFVLDTRFHEADLHEVVYEHVTTEVGLHRLTELRFHCLQSVIEFRQLIESPLQHFRLLRKERLLELVKSWLDRIDHLD